MIIADEIKPITGSVGLMPLDYKIKLYKKQGKLLANSDLITPRLFDTFTFTYNIKDIKTKNNLKVKYDINKEFSLTMLLQEKGNEPKDNINVKYKLNKDFYLLIQLREKTNSTLNIGLKF
jgi:hypothetical protein